MATKHTTKSPRKCQSQVEKVLQFWSQAGSSFRCWQARCSRSTAPAPCSTWRPALAFSSQFSSPASSNLFKSTLCLDTCRYTDTNKLKPTHLSYGLFQGKFVLDELQRKQFLSLYIRYLKKYLSKYHLIISFKYLLINKIK